MKSVIIAFALIGSADALRCYQGRQNASVPVQGSPLDCMEGSVACVITYDQPTDIVTRACKISNCTQDGAVASHPVCRGDSRTTDCCCYGDGCNAEIEGMNNLRSAAIGPNLVGSLAHRIEDFYDHNASTAERTFLRRVVNHVFQHIDSGSKNQR